MQIDFCDGSSCSKNTHYFTKYIRKLTKIDNETEEVELERSESSDGKTIIWVEICCKVDKGIKWSEHDELHDKLESSVPEGLYFS